MKLRVKPEELVLWVDDDLLVINKPAGLLTLPDGYDPKSPHVKSVFEPVFDDLWIVHRLDRDTSGILVLARNPAAHRSLNDQFTNHETTKVYRALVVGEPAWQEKFSDQPLRPDGDRRHRTVVDWRKGKSAITHFRVLERYGAYTLVEAQPKTGRTHQVRAHIATEGFPIVADGLYGTLQGIYLSRVKPAYRGKKSGERPLLDRLALHALSLAILHPETSGRLQFEAPYPKDFATALRQLRKYSSAEQNC